MEIHSEGEVFGMTQNGWKIPQNPHKCQSFSRFSLDTPPEARRCTLDFILHFSIRLVASFYKYLHVFIFVFFNVFWPNIVVSNKICCETPSWTQKSFQRVLSVWLLLFGWMVNDTVGMVFLNALHHQTCTIVASSSLIYTNLQVLLNNVHFYSHFLQKQSYKWTFLSTQAWKATGTTVWLQNVALALPFVCGSSTNDHWQVENIQDNGCAFRGQTLPKVWGTSVNGTRPLLSTENVEARLKFTKLLLNKPQAEMLDLHTDPGVRIKPQMFNTGSYFQAQWWEGDNLQSLSLDLQPEDSQRKGWTYGPPQNPLRPHSLYLVYMWPQSTVRWSTAMAFRVCLYQLLIVDWCKTKAWAITANRIVALPSASMNLFMGGVFFTHLGSLGLRVLL